MILIECPCCDEPLAIDLTPPVILRCDTCGVAWSIADPESGTAAPAAKAA